MFILFSKTIPMNKIFASENNIYDEYEFIAQFLYTNEDDNGN